MKVLLYFITCFWVFGAVAQRAPDKVFYASIKTVKLFPQNNQLAMPVINLNSGEQLELHFDDIDNYPKNYFYTYELCNADWTTAQWSPFDYIKGFQQNRLSQYRVSSIAQTQYVHYQAMLPERNAIPSRSGNYLLKVFQDGDTAKLLFTKRFYVVEQKAGIAAQLQQPFDFQLSKTHQKIQLAVNTMQLNIMNPQQIKTVILQNSRWDNAAINLQPSFVRGNLLEYNAEQDCVFPAGKEYRWIDLQSFRFESDRVQSIDRTVRPVEIKVKQDVVRNSLRYLLYRDLNGFSEIKSTEPINPWWQSDYAAVEFRLAPDKGIPFAGKQVFLMGELTGNQLGDTSLMQFDANAGVYTKKLWLKQGYYSYTYATRDIGKNPGKADPALTEGNYWETENTYSILVYYRALGGRHDELVGYKSVNSLQMNGRF